MLALPAALSARRTATRGGNDKKKGKELGVSIFTYLKGKCQETFSPSTDGTGNGEVDRREINGLGPAF